MTQEITKARLQELIQDWDDGFSPKQIACREFDRCVMLTFKAKNLEHELFRACMDSVVALRQDWSTQARAAQADRLEACARKYIASSKFSMT